MTVTTVKSVHVQFGDEQTLKDKFWGLSKRQLCLISKVCGEIRKEKYTRRKGTLYGNLRRGFLKDELIKLLINSPSREMSVYWLIQLFFGLRVGEVGFLEVCKGPRVLKVFNEKRDRIEYLPIHGRTLKLLHRLDEVKGYSRDHVRHMLRRAAKEANLNFSYGINKQGNKQYQFTTHSFRHTAVNLFGDFIKDPYKIRQFSRHEMVGKEVGVMAVYRHYGTEKMRVDLEEVFKDWYDLIDIVL